LSSFMVVVLILNKKQQCIAVVNLETP